MRFDGAAVRRLRLRGDFLRDGVTKLAATSLLSRAELEPSEVSPSSILVLRALTQTLPRGWRPSGPEARPSPSWFRAVTDRIRDAHAGAARPRQGRLPVEADAVLFADEAEMLACWWLDVALGCAADRWYWGAVFGAASGSKEALAPRLAERAMYVPSVVELLVAWREVPTAARAMSAADARRVAAAVSRAHGLVALATALERGAAPGVIERVAILGPAKPPVEPAPHFPVMPPQLISSGVFADELVALLALALALRSPCVPSESAIARAIALGVSSRRAVGIAGERPKDLYPSTASPEVGSPSTASSEGELAPQDRTPARELRSATVFEAVESASASQPGPRAKRARPAAGERAARILAEEEEGPPKTPKEPFAEVSPRVQPSLTLASERRRAAEARADVADAAQAEVAPELETSLREAPRSGTIATHLGGAFYLINALEQLAVNEVFAEWRLFEQVGAWAVFEGVARGVLSSAGTPAHDPLWAALSQLADREVGSALGEGLVAPMSPRMPAEWVAPVAARDRVELAALESMAAPGFARWLGLALPIILHRLCSALGVSSVEEVAAQLFRPARMEVTRSHVDVVFSLESISLPVRLAGLDQSPGWLPPYRRVITFHFV